MPSNWIGFKDDEGELVHDFRLRKGHPMAGVVRGNDGKPLAGAEVWLSNASYRTHIENGRADAFFSSDDMKSVTDAEGRYKFKPQDEPTGLVVLHDAGFARVTPEQLQDSPDVMIAPWARVEGIVRVGTKPVPDQPIRLTVETIRTSTTQDAFYEYTSRTDAQGRFVVERVLPGLAYAATNSRFGTTEGRYGAIGSGYFDVVAGESKRIAIGGTGRPVVGRIRVPPGTILPASLVNGTGRLVLKVPMPEMPRPANYAAWSREQQMAYNSQWQASPPMHERGKNREATG